MKVFSGKNLARARERAGLTRTQVAVEVGYSEQSVYLWERNDRVPRPRTVVVLASVLGVKPSALYEAVKRHEAKVG